tara:strand:- start:1600 stop:1887 length:288 start_codon:yes stop_codon:yes gene_type:complete
LSRSLILKKIKSKYPKLSNDQIEELQSLIIHFLRKNVLIKKPIEIRNFGTFSIKTTNEKKRGRNPKTGELIYVPKKNKLRFKASKFLNKFVNKDQ